MPPPLVVAEEFHGHLLPPSATPPPQSKCNSQNCPWWPYSGSKQFEANTALIIIIVFCALIFILSLNAAVRCLLLRRRRHHHQHETQEEVQEPKPAVTATSTEVGVPPILVFTREMNLAGNQAECIICLSEFVEGDEIRILIRCGHGFHIQCIHQWLSSHSSCPTCRASCYSDSLSNL